MSSYLVELLLRQIRDAHLPEPRLEYRFHSQRRFRFDLCWPEYLFAVEVNGAVWSGGRHVRVAGHIKDCEKYAEAQLLHYTVLVCPGTWIVDGGREMDIAIRYIQGILAPYIEADNLYQEIARARPEWLPIEMSRYDDGTWELLFEAAERETIAISSRADWERIRDLHMA